jgi:hypothetical protein
MCANQVLKSGSAESQGFRNKAKLRGTTPWGNQIRKANPSGVSASMICPRGRNPVGCCFRACCRVARASQPWALGRNPFGIGRLPKSDLHPMGTEDKNNPFPKFNLTANKKESIEYAVNRSLNNQLLLLGALLLCSVAVGL